MEVIKGSDLKLLLKKKGISQKDVVDLLGFNQTMVSRYYTGRNEMPASFILKVAALAKLEMSDLVKFEPIDTSGIVQDPPVSYKKTKIPSSDTSEVTIMVDGVSIAEKIQHIEQEMMEILDRLKDVEKKSKIKYEELVAV